jgi:hypothetical protein
MTIEEVQQLVAAFNFQPTPQAAQLQMLTRFGRDTADYLKNHHELAGFRKVVGDDIGKLRELLRFLDTDRPNYARGELLLAINDVFDLTVYRVTPTNSLVAQPVTEGAKCVELKALALADKQRLRAFYTKALAVTNREPEVWVQRIVALFLQNDPDGVLAALDKISVELPTAPIQDAERPTAQQRLGRIDNAMVKCLVKIKTKYPNWSFTGFTRWGPGNHGDPTRNYKEHFLKHVCNEDGNYLDEAAWWWNALEIRLRLDALQNPGTTPDEANLFQDNYLKKSGIKAFLNAHLPGRDNLKEALFVAYGQAYTDYAIKLSREMYTPIVETDGGRVMISGFAGHVIMFGRFDSPNSDDVGISSCYFVLPAQRAVKLDESKASMIIPLSRTALRN